MKSDLLKYKHYLLLLLALLIVNFVLEPLWQNAVTLQQKVYMDSVKASKISSLMAIKEDVEKQDGMLSIRTLKLQPYLFPASTESEFKLVAQGKIENILADANCNVERIGKAEVLLVKA